MREEESNWFSKWEEELPSPDELMPLSQSLITPDLALAFDIGAPATPISLLRQPNHHQSSSAPHPPHPYSSELDSSSAEMGGGVGGGGGCGDADQEPARTLKRPRLVWTPQLHKRFVDAVAHLGIKNAVPKTIMQLMSVDGLTRENVASHLQKYRLYLKRMQGINNGGGGGGGGPGPGGDSATDRLFASSPVPAHFLNRTAPGGGRPSSEQFVPYMPVAVHHQQMAAAAVVAAASQGQVHQGQYHQRQMGQFGQFEQHPFLGPPSRNGMGQNSGYHVEDLESNPVINGRKVLTLFPTGDD